VKRSEKQMNKNDILQILKQFKESNADRYKIVRLGLFGSGARDRRDKESDIDVVVVLSEADALNFVGIKQDLEEKFLCSVDVVRYREKMNPFLRKRIDREAVYV
jgi:uncharacterized protein